MGMQLRFNISLAPVLFGLVAFAILGGLIFSLAAGLMSLDPRMVAQPGACFGVSVFLFLYFRWARSRCKRVWSDTP